MKNENKSLVTRYYLATGLFHADFILPICLLYPVKQLGFSFTQATSFFVIIWVSTLVTDFFGGALADKFSRKKAYAYGTIVYALAATLPFLFVRWYPLFVVAAITAGVGYSLRSGSLDGMIANRLKDSEPELYRKANSHVQLWLFVSRASSALIGGALYLLLPAAPYIAYLAALLLSATIALGIQDNSSVESDNIPQIMKQAVVVFKTHVNSLLMPVLTLAVSVIGADVLFGYYQPFFSRGGLGEQQLGYLFAVASVFSALGAWLSHKISSSRMMVAIVLGFTLLEGLVFAFGSLHLALASIFLIGIVGGIAEPVTRLIINEHSEKKFRTSALSVGSSITMIGTLIGYQLSGVLADSSSAKSVGLVAVAAQVIALVFFIPYVRSTKTTA